MDYTVPVEFKKGTHTIEVKVIDLAGNESADDEGISFSVNQTAIERAVTKAAKNYWWLFIIIGVVVIGGVIFFVVKRQQNEE